MSYTIGLPADWAAIVPPSLLLRVALIASFVVVVALLAERVGPFLGGMVASLPIYAGPIYFVLALEHDADYLFRASIGSVAVNAATAVFILAYCMMARRHGVTASLTVAYAGWLLAAFVIQMRTWSLGEALAFVTVVFAAIYPLVLRFTRGIAIRGAPRRWTDLPLRAVLVAAVAGGVIWLSSRVPAQLTGILSIVPIVMTSIIIILQPRVGGAATAALLGHTLSGMYGMVLAFAAMNMTLYSLGVFPALALGLVVAISWNLILITVRQARSVR